MRRSAMYKVCKSGINIFGVIPLCQCSCRDNNFCSSYTIGMKLHTVNSFCNDIGCNDIPDVTIQIRWSLSISIYSILLVYNDILM